MDRYRLPWVEEGPMQVPVIVEQVGSEYRARCRHPVAAEATGGSRFEAIANVEQLLRDRLQTPVDVLAVDASAERPWVAFAGSVPDGELTEAWLDAVAAYRRECDGETASPAVAQAAS